jgi:hypothetical protein
MNEIILLISYFPRFWQENRWDEMKIPAGGTLDDCSRALQYPAINPEMANYSLPSPGWSGKKRQPGPEPRLPFLTLYC